MIFPIVSFADEVTSQAGIYFNEKEDIKNTDENKYYNDSQKNSENNIEFPQTGEYKKQNLYIIGLVIFMSSILIKKNTQHKEEEK